VWAGIAAGLGTLTKVVGFLSYLVLLPWLYAVWRAWPGVRWQRPFLMWLASAAAWCAVVAAWLLPIWLRARHDPAVAGYFHELLVTQTFDRYVEPWHHLKPFWYYVQVMATLWLPTVALLPWLVPCWRESLRQRDARVLLPLGFVLLYLVFFTLSPGKRDVYILSALPMLALVAGPLLPALLQRPGVQRTCVVLGALIVWASLGTAVWFTAFRPDEGRALLAEGGVAGFAPLLLLGECAVLAFLPWYARRSGAQYSLAATLTAGWLIVGFWVFPQMDGRRSARDFIARVEQVAAPDRPLGLLEYRESFLWHLTRPTVNFGHRRFREGDQEAMDAAAWLAAAPGHQLLVPRQMLAPCFVDAESVQEVGAAAGGDWYLVQGQPQPDCVARGDARRALRYDPRP
jgi:4-amino-4-deoxy-L-arabinose transferase-like glycosyltransferase